MMIWEAIKSGKPFRRKSKRNTTVWMYVVKNKYGQSFGVFDQSGTKKKNGWNAGIFDPRDILGHDWEIKQ